MTKHRILPHAYYEHTTIGHAALLSLTITRESIDAGLTCCSFIYAQIEAAATLEISVFANLKNASCSISKWWHTFSRVPGFCWTKLLSDHWLVPAVCTLGAYSLAADVACLSPYFHGERDLSMFEVLPSGIRHGSHISHMSGCATPISGHMDNRLRLLGGLVGLRHTLEPRFP